jgi:Hom_end-associated Hint
VKLIIYIIVVKMAQVVNECPICIETFTASTRKEIVCPYCNYKSCLKCMKQHILNQQNPNCMNCHIEFNREFIDLNMTKNFRTKELKLHRENVLLEREKSLLPATITYVEQEKARRTMESDIKGMEEKIKELLKEVANVQQMIMGRRAYHHRMVAAGGAEAMEASTSQGRRAFVKACVVSGCRGFLSSQYKCGICDTWVCPDCHEVKDGQKDEEHKCNPETVQSIKLIAKETKPCPKCGIVISKIDGCFAKNTPILLWNGQIKMSQDIGVGDVLVGDDGLPRNVLETTSGEDDLYAVKQENGDKYAVNSKHTLVLKTEKYQTLEIVVDDYMKRTQSYKDMLKGYKLFENEIEELTSIKVKPIGKGTYYGWSVDGNKRFLLKDKTVVRNCNQMWCTECHTTFDWASGRETFTNSIHNPHYFEWVRRNNNGVVPRNPLDIPNNPCGDGRLPNVYRITSKYPNPSTVITRITTLLRVLTHIQAFDVHRPQNNDVETLNRDLRVKYLMQEMTEVDLKKQLQQREKKETLRLRKVRFLKCLSQLQVNI